MKRILPLLALLALPAAGALPHPASYEFDYGAKFTVSGYAAGKPALSGFPVLVRIRNGSPSGFSYDDLQSKSTGADIAFVDMDGNGLPFEIDTWDPSGESLIWVKLPTMQNGTAFVMCWGSATSGKTVCGTNPWSDYVGVWHMSEASGTVSDATGHGLGAEPAGATQYSVGVSGKIGGARQNSTAQSGRVYLLVPNYNDRGVGSAFTVSGWFNSKGVPSSDMRLFSRKYKYTDSGGWEVLVKESGKSPKVRGGTNAKQVEGTFNPVLKDTGWQFVTFVFDGTTAATFQNGIQLSSGEIVAATDNGQPLGIGSYGGGTESGSFFIGDMDEARLRPGTVTADWIAADYATQTSDSFLTAGAAEEYRQSDEPAVRVSVGSVQTSDAVVTVTVDSLGAGATGGNVDVQVASDSGFATVVASSSWSVSGPGATTFPVTGLSPATPYWARATLSTGAGAAAASVPVRFTTAASGSSDKIVPGLEDFGALTLVDEIDCARDTTHRFRDYPAGRSYNTNILGRLTRVMHHVKKEETSKGERTGAYVSWRVGEGKGIVPNDPYLLVVDYPDDAPRSVTLFDFGIAARHGYHTGFTVGESMSPQVAVPQVLESVAVPFSHEWRQLVEVVFPFERATQYDGGSRIDVAQNGFDVDFVLLSQDQATDSVGLAVQSIRLYRIDDYAAAKPEIHYPAGDAPRRYVTSREEMGDNDGLVSYDTPVDYYVGKARIMSLLGMNCFSRDLLEFGYVQGWSSNRRWGWNADASLWGKTVDAMAAEGHYLLPQYEYHGSRGDGNTRYVNGGSLGYDAEYRPWTLKSAENANAKYDFSSADWVKKCSVDLTQPEACVDLKDLMDRTILAFKDRGNFVGAWIRSRGGMPVGFSDKAIALFNEHRADSGLASVTRNQIWNNGNYDGTTLYNAYREWWYGKRRDLFEDVRTYMATNGLPDAKFFYHSCSSEGGRPVGIGVIQSVDSDTLYNERTWLQMTGKSGQTSLTAMASDYWTDGIGKDGSDWGGFEVRHADPADDYENYESLEGVALSYPFNAVHTVAGPQAGQHYRNASGDLVFLRHYSLNEFCANDYNLESGQAIVGYYTTDMDHAGRAVMVSELYAMAVNDPTILGYLFGSNLTRLDAPAVREFNLNFLSLPAIPSTVLSGGTCSDPVTVRRWTTSAGNYWAVINVTGREAEDDFDLQTAGTRVWRTVDWREEAVSGGKVHLRLKPYQMVCLTDIEPTAIVAPVFGECGADDLAAHTATLSFSLSSLGENASFATVAWTLSGGPAAASSGSLAFSGPGAEAVALSGLAPETAYAVSLEATASTGKKAYASVSFATPRFPVALGVPVVDSDEAGTTATASVVVSRADADATLVLASGGATVSNWTHVAAGGVYAGSFPVGRESTVPFVFELVHEDAPAGERYEAEACGVAVGVPMHPWLDIRFDKSAYGGWSLPASSGADPAVGGTWTRSGEENDTVFATDGGNRRLELDAGPGGSVGYGTSPSAAGCAVRVNGRAKLVSEPGLPETPSGHPRAGLALGDDGSGVALYGWTAAGWIRLAGAPVAENEWIDWNATVDFTATPVTVSYGIGGTVLSNATTGATALPAADGAGVLSSVIYEGNGVVDDFRGTCFLPVVVEIKEPDFADVAAPVSMNPPSEGAPSGTLDLEITLKGQPAGVWFTAFECENLSSDRKDWVVLRPSVQPDAKDLAAGSVGLSVGADKTSKFVKIVVSKDPIPVNTKLSQLDLED